MFTGMLFFLPGLAESLAQEMVFTSTENNLGITTSVG